MSKMIELRPLLTKSGFEMKSVAGGEFKVEQLFDTDEQAGLVATINATSRKSVEDEE